MAFNDVTSDAGDVDSTEGSSWASPLFSGGAKLVSGLFGIAAQRAAERRRLLQDAAKTEAETGTAAANAMTKGQQTAFGDLMNAWRSALIG